MMSGNRTQLIKGNEVIKEATQLLRRMRFDAYHGDYLSGKYVEILVAPRWNDDNETLSLLVTCLPLRPQQVDWLGLPIFLEERDEEGITRNIPYYLSLNARGQGIATNIAPGDYFLSASDQWGRSQDPINLSSSEEWIRTYESKDGRIKLTVVHTKIGKLVVSAETHEQIKPNTKVRFNFAPVGKSEVRWNGEFTLVPSVRKPGLWEGIWIEGVNQEIITGILSNADRASSIQNDLSRLLFEGKQQTRIAAESVQEDELIFCTLS